MVKTPIRESVAGLDQQRLAVVRPQHTVGVQIIGQVERRFDAVDDDIAVLVDECALRRHQRQRYGGSGHSTGAGCAKVDDAAMSSNRARASAIIG
ncbi:MAG: hypothetical protein HND48_24210 [Chloroflexi bacterium]|nr:hypothetical protein [Chloroflexota bacterium]